MTKVVDLSNYFSFEDGALMKFFETSTSNLLAQETAVGVRHRVDLSLVATEHLFEGGYFQVKIARKKLIKGPSILYSIVRGMQFVEFLNQLVDISFNGEKVQCPVDCSKASCV